MELELDMEMGLGEEKGGGNKKVYILCKDLKMIERCMQSSLRKGTV